jgi:hypothetical protein
MLARGGRGRRWLLAACVLAPAALGLARQASPTGEAWTLALAPPAPHAALALEPLPALAQLDCARCHADIAREWSVTQHAHAWIDPVYQKALKDKRRPESCHGCHIPTPLLQEPEDRFGKKPLPRAADEEALELGIGCNACHAGKGGAIHGPFGAPTEAHASVRDERFLGTGSNALCSACHLTTVGPVIGVAKDFELAGLAARGMSCVGCHMQAVERPLGTDAGGAPTEPRAGRSHELQTPRDPAFLAQAFELAARREGGASVLSIKNRAGHRVPGLVDRRITFAVEALDAAGAVLTSAEHTLDATAYLPLEGEASVRLPVDAAALRVAGTHFPSAGQAGIPFLSRTLELP